MATQHKQPECQKQKLQKESKHGPPVKVLCSSRSGICGLWFVIYHRPVENKNIEIRMYSQASNGPEDFSALYKYKNKPAETIQQRRENFLQELRKRRQNAADRHRGKEFPETEKEPIEEGMEYEETSPRKSTKYKLMLTDWFTELPEDFEGNWLIKLVPEGFRVLLIAKHRKTICYSERGKCVLKIRSNFPGGGGTNESIGLTILDCILNMPTKTVFVLDCLCWNNMVLIHSEAKFRFYWLLSKFQETPDLKKCISYNFLALEPYPAQRCLIQDRMSDVLSVDTHQFCYDGVVFYHQESEYTLGYSPLVGWLASYMLPEVLNVDVDAQNLKKKPPDYVNIQDYIKQSKQKKKKGGKHGDMEVD